MGIYNRIHELDLFLSSSDFELVDYYKTLTAEECDKHMQRLTKEYEISARLNKNLKNIKDVMNILSSIIEYKSLVETLESENETKGVIIG